MPYDLIQTPRLKIRERIEDDLAIEQIHDKANPELSMLDPSVGECVGPTYYTILSLEHGNRPIGICSIYNVTDKSAEIGVRIYNKDFWNKGYGKEVVNALCDVVFLFYTSVTYIKAKSPIYNVRAAACYRKCGFEQQQTKQTIGGYEMFLFFRYRTLSHLKGANDGVFFD